MRLVTSMIVGCAALLALAPVSARAGARIEEDRATITVSPVSVEATVKPGQTSRGVVDVFNVGAVPVTLRAEVESIRVGDDGSFQFRRAGGKRDVASFVSVERAPFRLQPGAARRVAYSVTIPRDAWTGGYFGSLLFRVVSPEKGAGVAVRQQARLGTLLILRADGPADRRGELVDLRATGAGLSRRRGVDARFRNTGGTEGPALGVAYRPVGTVEVTNLLGRRVLRAKVEGRLLLPGETARLRTDVDRHFWFGRYTATMDVGAGPKVKRQSESVTFWAFSGSSLVVLAAIALVVLIVVLGRRRRAGGRSEP